MKQIDREGDAGGGTWMREGEEIIQRTYRHSQWTQTSEVMAGGWGSGWVEVGKGRGEQGTSVIVSTLNLKKNIENKIKR